MEEAVLDIEPHWSSIVENASVSVSLLNTYSNTGLPPMPDLLNIGRHQVEEAVLDIEPHWSSIVENASVSWMGSFLSRLAQLGERYEVENNIIIIIIFIYSRYDY